VSGDNALPKASLVLMVGGIPLPGLLYETTRLLAQPVVGTALGVHVFLLGALGALGIFVFVAARRAHHHGHRAWLVAILAFWPLADAYTLLVRREGG
jgi:hypothetical protein